ncbi:phosphatase PAP2 family protein [Paenibacillus eucommiae]|uniref:Undecaprenyl-diphosphatase n=1 Tax=Paenibacillus eucommiae TaxID=1355755 RepID=A0ABS4JAP7_9BACL|nr:phosphatase PAP2 family protein [Paenibacillus eucommiae]MBP1996310.1 undecaprenyl-diphosphatase [Paenibacillus eucommiae]
MMMGFTIIGSGGVISFLALLMVIFLYKVLKHRKELILFVGVIAGSALLNVWLKILFHRARPDLHRIIDASGFSFPSGHSMAAFSMYGIFAFLLWRHLSTSFKRISLVLLSTVMIIAIGLSRIYLGVHYPSDVLGGYLVSGTWLTLSIWFYQHYSERWSSRSANRMTNKS